MTLRLETRPARTVAATPLPQTTTIWAAIVAGASLVAGLVDQIAPFVPEKYRPVFFYIAGIANAIGLWRGRAATKRAAAESLTIAARTAAVVAEAAAPCPPMGLDPSERTRP